MEWDEFVEQSRSFVVDRFRDGADSLMLAMGKLQTVTADCVETDARLKEEIKELQAEYVDAAMHCRRLTAEELVTLDVRVAMELDDTDHTAVVVPFRSADDLCQSRWTPHFEADGLLETYVNNGCFAFVGISCDVHAIQIAGVLTLLHNPCLPPRLGPGTIRLGQTLRILFLADNNLGAHNLQSILKGMRHSKNLEVFHCHSNGIGELGEGSSQQSPDQDPTDSLSAMDDMADIFRARECPLRVVGLSKNGMGSAGLSRLMPGIAANTSITILDLSENCIGVAGANHIAKCLVTNRTLQTLNVNNTMMTHYGLKAICSALKFNPSLRILYALRNVGPAARQDIFRCMEENSTMEVMHIFLDTPWINPNFLGAKSAPEIAKFDDIPGGVPFLNRVALIRAFSTFGQISNASQSDINAVPGMKVSLSSVIFDYLHTSESGSWKGTASSGQHTVGVDAALALLESKGYFQEVDDPWNITGCLDQGPVATWQPVATESFRLEFSKRQRPDTSGTQSSMMIPTPAMPTPERGSTAESQMMGTVHTLGTPNTGKQEVLGRTTSEGSEHSFARTTSSRSALPSGASQVEERLRENEKKRLSTKGVHVLWANVAMKTVDLSAKPLAQWWGPPRKVGVNSINSQQILGLGVKGTVKKAHLTCMHCAQMGGSGRAGVGEKGHEDYECPVYFFKETGELLPGFTRLGYKDPELWEPGEAETKIEVKAMWDRLQAKGYFTEPAEGIAIIDRTFKFNDVSRAGVARKFWDERGGFMSKDGAMRREMFDSTKRSGEALFSHGTRELNAFLRERSGLSDSGNESVQQRGSGLDYHLPSADEMSIQMRARLHVGGAGGGNHLSRTDVHMSTHDGVSFIPSATMRKHLFLQKIRNNHFAEVKDLIDGKYGTIDVNTQDVETGSTALIEAAQSGVCRVSDSLMCLAA